jgi:hypothetical protein
MDETAVTGVTDCRNVCALVDLRWIGAVLAKKIERWKSVLRIVPSGLSRTVGNDLITTDLFMSSNASGFRTTVRVIMKEGAN